jgi:DNA uptake protein ComE-like DNA-binding protein
MNRKIRLPLLLAWALALPAMAQAELMLVNPNLADKEELQALPNVDDEIAQAIIDGRPYQTAIDLDTTLAGVMEDEQRATLYTRLFRPIDLNNASEAEILLIPGMSKKMAHEFLEYRPYKSMEQFRREIGKYVDDDEVARLESYVTLN